MGRIKLIFILFIVITQFTSTETSFVLFAVVEFYFIYCSLKIIKELKGCKNA